ncbi:MAG TPA: TolC family protein [Isosphaeraceae bacterium]|nr:TolC family protein [Isosphaeraceae bacterium]
MKLRLFFPVLVLLSTLGVPMLCADDSITLEQARTHAVARSKALQKLLLSVDSARLGEKIQSYTLLPSITATAGASVAVPEAVLLNMLGASAGITVTQTVYDGGKSSLLSAIDSLATSIARENARDQYFSVLSAAETAYYNTLEAAASVAAAQSDLDDAQANQNLAQAKNEVGILSQSDYLKTESETAAKKTSLVQAQGKLSVAQRTLASLTGLPLPLKLVTTESEGYNELMQRLAGYSERQIETLVTNLLEAAAKNNPSLSQSELASKKAKSAVDLARADYLPSISASWTNSLVFADSSEAGSSALSITASLPLDMWNTQASVESKTLAARQAALDQEETQRTLDLEIESAVFDSISSARAVSSSQKALDYAASHYQSVLERFKLSSAAVSDLSDAEMLVSTNRTALITARYGFLSNISSLRTYAGFETDDLLIALIP